MTVYTCHNKLCVSIPTIVPAHPHTLFGMSLQLVFAVICHFHIAHDASCLIRPRSSPPPKKKEKKKTICIRITFNFTWVLTTFTKTIMHLVYSPKFALPLPERNWKQSLYITHLFIYCTFLGGGRGNKQGALWSMCKWRITAKTIVMHFFGGGGWGKTRTYYARAMWKWRIDLVIVPDIIVSWFLFLLFCFVFFAPHTLKFRNQFNKHKFLITDIHMSHYTEQKFLVCEKR